jgi:hypothetical protein
LALILESCCANHHAASIMLHAFFLVLHQLGPGLWAWRPDLTLKIAKDLNAQDRKS